MPIVVNYRSSLGDFRRQRLPNHFAVYDVSFDVYLSIFLLICICEDRCVSEPLYWHGRLNDILFDTRHGNSMGSEPGL